jgi:hypothetical protein
LNTFALPGIDAVPVEAEVDVSAGLPRTAIKESGHRVPMGKAPGEPSGALEPLEARIG